MTRRTVLTAAELALTASALSAAVYGLVRAADDPGATVQWVPIAAIGAVTALAIVGFAAALVVGQVVLELTAAVPDAIREWRRRRAAPPSKTRRPLPGDGTRPVAPGCGRHAQAMAAVAADLPRVRPRTSVYGASQAARGPAQLPPTLPLPAPDDTVALSAVGAQ